MNHNFDLPASQRADPTDGPKVFLLFSRTGLPAWPLVFVDSRKLAGAVGGDPTELMPRASLSLFHFSASEDRQL